MTTYARSERVSRHIRSTLADVLRRHVKDPRLQRVTITDVDVSTDLRLAKIYFVTASDEEKIQRVLDGFQKARPYIKRLLGQELGLRYMPDLRFYYDDSLDHGARMEALFRSIGEVDGRHHRPSE
jgi:ribosome-binding factor A